MTPGKSKYFSDAFFKPCGASGEADRAPREQVGLGNHTSELVGVGLVGGDIDGLLPKALDQTAADRRVLDHKRGRTIASLNLHHLPFEHLKRKAAAYHLENVKDVFAVEQNDTRRIIAGLSLAQGNVPAHDNAVAGLIANIVVNREPFSFNDRATGRDRALLVLRRKRNRAHLALEFHQHMSWLMLRTRTFSRVATPMTSAFWSTIASTKPPSQSCAQVAKATASTRPISRA